MAADHSLDPDDWGDLRAQGHRMLDDMLDHLERLREQPVWRPMTLEARSRFRTAPPSSPTPLALAHQRFLDDVLPYAGGNLHPGFMGWVQGAGSPVGMLAEMLAGGLNANLGGRDHAAIEIEREVTGWVRQIMGFPDTASGLFVTGASMANFIGVLVARNAALGLEARQRGLVVEGVRLTAYSSTAAHACVVRAMEMAGLGSAALRLAPVDADHRIDLNGLRAAIDADRVAGFTPFLIVGTAGTVDVGAIDDLVSLADIAAEEGLHLHVDGAFGALGMLAADIAPRLKGLERADSLALDFHKWGQAPYDAGFVMVRDEKAHRETFASPVAYLQRDQRGMAAGDWWPCDYGPDLSRGFRALKVWFTLKVLGADAIGAAITRSCALARELADRVAAEPELELLAPVPLNIVCFRYRCDDPDAVNAAIVADLQEAGRVAPSLTRIGGQIAIRAALFNHRTAAADLDALVDSALDFGRARTTRAGAA